MSVEQDLAERFGTPLYVYDLAEVEAARRELFAALPAGCVLYYALKANPHPDVARAVRNGDGPACRAEISSTGELLAALAAGFAPTDCLYTGPGKTATELRQAIGRGVTLFSTDSVTDVEHVGAVAREYGVQVRCLLRVNAATASAASSIRMTGRPSQFGFDSEDLPAAVDRLRRVAGVRIAGLHYFPLSNAADEDDLVGEFRHTVEHAAALAADLDLPLELLDIGGGFAAPYGTPGGRGEYPKLRGELESTLDTHLPGWRSGAPAIACESGRFLVAGAGTLLLGVVNVKTSRGQSFAVTDGGINVFGGMSGLGRLLPVAIRPDGEVAGRASVVGPLCTPGDVLGRGIEVPALAPGTVLAVPNAGSYGPTASLLAFLGRPAPTEVVVRGPHVVSTSRLTYDRTYL